MRLRRRVGHVADEHNCQCHNLGVIDEGDIVVFASWELFSAVTYGDDVAAQGGELQVFVECQELYVEDRRLGDVRLCHVWHTNKPTSWYMICEISSLTTM